MNDIVFIEQMQVEAILGILTEERTTPQPVVIDLELETDTRPAAQSKNIADALDYATLAEEVKRLTIDGKYLLIETLINDIADLCLGLPLTRSVRVRVCKPDAVDNARVGVQIYRVK